MTLVGRFTSLSSRHAPRLSRRFSRAHAAIYRRTGGRRLPRWFGTPVLVLTVPGRRTGQPRSTPLIYVRRGDDLVVCAANAGADRTPAWWLNLQAGGEGTVEIGGEAHRVRPRVADGAEREELWAALRDAYPHLDTYPKATTRELPVVVLEKMA